MKGIFGSRAFGAITAALVATVIILGGASSAKAQGFTVQLTGDENGNGSLSNSAGFFSPLLSFLQNDPGPGGLANALTYDMENPPGLVAGDLLINEFGTGTLGDVIRFNPNEVAPNGNTGVFVFYSLDALGSMADIGGPSANYTNVLTVTEALDGSLVYTPTAGQPGFVAGAGGPVTYKFTSDEPAPEPASMLLFGSALAGLGVVRRRRRR